MSACLGKTRTRRRAERNAVAWLYDITIDEEERGRGYGRAAMTALED
jgi:GNAT superfamily N-acetyltransferase